MKNKNEMKMKWFPYYGVLLSLVATYDDDTYGEKTATECWRNDWSHFYHLEKNEGKIEVWQGYRK